MVDPMKPLQGRAWEALIYVSVLLPEQVAALRRAHEETLDSTCGLDELNPSC